MKNIQLYRFKWIAKILILVLTVAGCATQVEVPSTDLPIVPASQPASPEEESIPPKGGSEPTPEHEHEHEDGEEPHEHLAVSDMLYGDDFTDPASGWPQENYDNYFIGYHEPDYYHVQVQSPYDKTLVPVPGKPTFEDATIEVKVFTDLDNTAEDGDYLYGVVFRRSGDQYYAFTISPYTQKWYVLKSSLNALEVLREGSDNSIQGTSLETQDTLRVDAKGPGLFFHINDRLVDQFSDLSYTSGEVAFFVQTFDRTRIHAHFNSITIRDVQPLQPQTQVLFEDDFTDPSSGWPQENYDNYFIGYHEPDYYHVQVQSPNDKTLVPVPGKPVFEDATIEVKVFTDLDNTAEDGDYLYGVVLRRSGDQYYAFTISPYTQKWYVLKSSINTLEVLREGSDDSIQGMSLETQDTLRVDAKGSSLFFHINDRLVDQFSDTSYASGEVAFFVQTFDRARIHAHFNSISIREVQPPLMCRVIASMLYLRSGPSTLFAPLTFLTEGERIEPLGQSADGEWIRVRVESSNQQGWVVNTPSYVSCNIAIADLQVVEP
ncbi:MAG: SH3 domain-containing protein [Anaerolineales bacterium]